MAFHTAQQLPFSTSDAAHDAFVVESPLLRATVRVEPALHQATVELFGELDLAGVKKVELALGCAERSGMPVVLVDLSGLHFIDLSGRRLLLAADERARRRGRRLVLLRPPRDAFTVFALTGADERLLFLD